MPLSGLLDFYIANPKNFSLTFYLMASGRMPGFFFGGVKKVTPKNFKSFLTPNILYKGP
jgi:hypothetical protein